MYRKSVWMSIQSLFRYLLSSSFHFFIRRKDHSILLDCGGATCAQINRFYGDEAPEIYRRLKAVYVSHMHQDHYFGLPELFRRRQMHLPLNREPLRVFCPLVDLKSWLLFYADRVDPIHTDIKFIDNQILVRAEFSKIEKALFFTFFMSFLIKYFSR